MSFFVSSHAGTGESLQSTDNPKLNIITVILLYQRWIYRVDYTRANEYGQILEEAPVAGLHEGNAGKVLLDELRAETSNTIAKKALRERKGKQSKKA